MRRNFTKTLAGVICTLMVLCMGSHVSAQTPDYIGTDVADGLYIHQPFTTVYSTFSQYRTVAVTSATAGSRILEFTAGLSYSDVWRANAPGQILPAFNSYIDPVTQNASATYHSSFGGSSIQLPSIIGGDFYTINIMNNRGLASDTMAVLQTSYNPLSILTVTQTPVAALITNYCPVTVTATLSGIPDPNEYFYIRYSTVAFGNASTAIQMTVVGNVATATIPALPAGTNIQYYILSTPVAGLATTGRASGFYDVLTLNLNNNGGPNYQYTVASAGPAPTTTITASNNNFCQTTVLDTFAATTTNSGLLPTYQWYKNGMAVLGAITDTLIATVVDNDSFYVVVQPNVLCAAPDTSNTIHIHQVPTSMVDVSITAKQTAICTGAIDTFTATPVNGGTAPSYQWYKNGVAVGPNGPVYIDPSLHDNDSVWLVLTSNIPCPDHAMDTSNTIYIDVFPIPVSGTLTPSPAAGPVCDGALVSATATAGSGGTGTIADSLQYRLNGGTWLAYTSGSNLNTTGLSSVDIRTYRTATGSGCTTSVPNTVSWTVFPQPVSGTLTPTPAAGNVCNGAMVSAIATAGSGGAGTAVDSVLYRFDGGAFQVYTSGTNLNTTGHTSVDIETFRSASGGGCTPSTANAVSWFIVAQPASGTLTPSPATGAVCSGATVSATATAGSGGAGSIADSLQYRFDGGTWLRYTSGSSLNTTGHSSVDIQTYRTASGSGCNSSAPNTVSWSVVAQPVSGTLTPSPTSGNVCVGGFVSATATAGSGGAGTVADSLQYRYDSGAWQMYISGTLLATTGHSTVDIRTFRTATGSGCNTSAPTTTTFNVRPYPVDNIGTAPVVQCGGNVILDAGNAGSTYMWSDGSTGRLDTASTSSIYTVTVTTAYGCKDTFGKQIYIKPVPVVNLGRDFALCSDSTILDAGNRGAHFMWNAGSTSEYLVVYTTGTYSVIVTDTSSHCSASDSITVTFNTSPTVDLGPDTSICGNIFTLDAQNPGATYLWSDSSTGQTLNISTTGNYSVTVTEIGGCTGTDSRFVNFNSQPNLGPDVTDSICPSSTTSLYNYYQGSGLAMTYNTANPSMVAPGVYTVVGRNNAGCRDTAMITINSRQAPNLGPDQTDSVCIGSTDDLTTIIPDSNYTTYNWNTPNPHAAGPGTYMVIASNGAGCSDTAMVTIINRVAQPTVNLGPDTTVCGGPITLDAGNAGSTYLWSDSSTGQLLNVSMSGNYSVTVTNANGCTATDSKLVIVNPRPDLGPDVSDSICNNSTADLYNYYQNSGLALTYNTPNPHSVGAGTYTVTGTNSNGCTDTALITITYRLKPSAGPDVTDSVCIGSTADLTALIPNTGYYSYTWNTNNPQAAGPGMYMLVVSNASGCSDTAYATIINRVAQPFVDLGPDTTVCGGPITLDAGNPGSTYLWSDSTMGQLLNVFMTGNYSVTVTNANGCSASDSRLVVINARPNLGPDVTDSICPASRANLYNYYVNSGLALTYSTATPNSVDSGVYMVVGTNSNGCTDTAMITIIYRQKPNAGGAKTDSICPGSTYDLTTLYPNTGYTTYTWNTPTPTAVGAGTYRLIVSNASGCTDTATATITNRQKPNLGGDKTDSICRSGGYDLRSLYPNTGYTTYTWNVGNDSSVSAGTYQLIVTNGSGCSDTAYATITFRQQPVVTIPTYPNVCNTNPDFVVTGAMPLGGRYFIDWVADSLFSPSRLGAGVHHVNYEYTNGSGCTDSSSVDITVYPQPVIYDTVPFPVICSGSPALDLNNYFMPNGGNFSGSGVSGNYFYPSIAAAGTDSITYVYTDQHGCMDTAGRTITITPGVHVSLHTDQSNFTICRNQAITFTASGATFYQFFVNDSAQGPVDTTSTFTTSTLNNHDEVKVVGSNTCSSDTSEFMIIDVRPTPTVNAGPDTTIDLGQSVQLNATATGTSSLVYSWTPTTALNFSNIPNPTYSGADTVTFQVKVTDADGCSAVDSVTVNVRIPDNVVLPNFISPNGDGKNDKWVLNPKIDLIGSHLVIFNRWGELVFETDNYANDWAGTYKSSGHKVPDGTYYYVLTVPAQHNHTYKGPINVLSSETN